MKKQKKHVENHLMIGLESAKMIDCLIGGTKITGERKIKALHDHFVRGRPIGTAAVINDLPQSNLSDAIEALNKIAGVCQKFHELKMLTKFYQDKK